MDISKTITNNINGVLGALLGFILMFLLIGTDSMVTQINNALNAICNSGWPLAGLFSTDGVMPLILMVGIVIAGTSLGLGVGASIKGRK